MFDRFGMDVVRMTNRIGSHATTGDGPLASGHPGITRVSSTRPGSRPGKGREAQPWRIVEDDHAPATSPVQNRERTERAPDRMCPDPI